MDNTQNQPLQIPQEVRGFLESLLTDAGMTTLDETMREEMIKELYSRLDHFLTSKIIEVMPPEHLDEFIKLNEEKKSREEIEAYLKDKIPNSQEVFTKAFAEFRDLYLGNVAVARNAPAQEPAKQTEPQQS
ncbi:MAG: hypothetical protein HYW64_01780 [Candidatus Levybacteria bacterium]|nr:hypothetical protein [Candidatus Levybacteria bacterium]